MKNQPQKKSRWLWIITPAIIILAWLIVAGVGGPFFGRIEEVSTNNLADFLPNSSESAQVQDRLSDFTTADTIPALVVLVRNDALQESDKQYAAQLQTDFTSVVGVAPGISPPIISEDNQAIQVVVPIDTRSEVKEATEALRAALEKSAPDGLDHYVAGPAGFSADLSEAFSGIDGILLVVALAVVFVILVLVYRSPILPFIVLSTSIFALAASILAVWFLANEGVIRLNGQVQGILFILVIGAATDYSLLYVARYREELAKFKDKLAATRAAIRGSIEPILASGGTVIIGLLCLLLSDLDSNKALGPVGGIGIVMSMSAALTFLPAMLYAFGRNVFWPYKPKYQPDLAADVVDQKSGIWVKIAGFVDRRARIIWAVSLALLLVAALGALQFRATGIAQSDLILGESESRSGQEKISKHFPAGSGSPALIIAPYTTLDQTITSIQDIDRIDSIVLVSGDSPTGGIPVGVRTPGFESFEPTVVDSEVMLRVTLVDESDSKAAEETVLELRKELQKIDDSIIVGGATATTIDTTAASIRDRTLIIPVALLAIFLVLTVLLRSILAPLLLIATTALSFAAALGVSALLFNEILGFPGAEASLPLYAFVFLVALGIDYNIFLMTRVREETILRGTRKGTLRGLTVTGGVITSAGVVLAATFAALSVIPIIFLVQLSFIVAFGVLLDTLLVRSLFVPALIIDIGKKSWWPSKLSK